MHKSLQSTPGRFARRLTVIALAAAGLTLLFSVLGAFLPAPPDTSWNWKVPRWQDGGAVGGLVVAIVGIFLAALAVFEQVRANTVQVQLADQIEAQFLLLQVRLRALSHYVTIAFDHQEDQRSTNVPDITDEQMASIERGDIHHAPPLPFTPPTRTEILKRMLSVKMQSLDGADGFDVVSAFYAMEPVILAYEDMYAAEKLQQEQARGFGETWIETRVALHFLHDCDDLEDEGVLLFLRHADRNLRKCLRILDELSEKKALSSLKIQQILFLPSRRQVTYDREGHAALDAVRDWQAKSSSRFAELARRHRKD